MAGVYSTQFISASAAAGSPPSYTTPAGYVAIITDVFAQAASAPASTLWFALYLIAGHSLINVVSPASGPAEYSLQGTRIVLPAGQTVEFYAPYATVLYVGGYLLQA